MKNGDRLSGVVLELNRRRLLIENHAVLVTVPAGQVHRVVFTPTTPRRLILSNGLSRSVFALEASSAGLTLQTEGTAPFRWYGADFSLRTHPSADDSVNRLQKAQTVEGSPPLHGQSLLFHSGDRMSGQLLRFSTDSLLLRTPYGTYRVEKKFVHRVLVADGLPVTVHTSKGFFKAQVLQIDEIGLHVTDLPQPEANDRLPPNDRRIIPWTEILDEILLLPEDEKSGTPSRSAP